MQKPRVWKGLTNTGGKKVARSLFSLISMITIKHKLEALFIVSNVLFLLPGK